MKHFSFSCQGESHKATDKPCQDSSLSYSEDGLSIAIVCDGHGGERYFRSDVGSRFCAKITEEAIKQFVDKVDKFLFIGKSFTQKKAISESCSSEKLNETDNALRHLFASIIFAWNNEIEQYTDANPPSEDELKKVKPQYIEALKNKVSLEKIYGCTLITYVQTPDYWFAFHLGDGKCISFHKDEVDIWKEPIPWDEKCFLNKTTSICDSAALDEFRYCYQGDGNFPAAIFLGSDGMDDSFGSIENLVEFYMQVAKLLAKGNDYEAKKSIEETLPVLSKRGSQDDMSIAYIYDLAELRCLVCEIVEYQINHLKKQVSDIQNKINELQKQIASFTVSTERKDVIVKNYAVKDLEKYSNLLNQKNSKLNARQLELGFYSAHVVESDNEDDSLSSSKRNIKKRRKGVHKKREKRKHKNRQ